MKKYNIEINLNQRTCVCRKVLPTKSEKKDCHLKCNKQDRTRIKHRRKSNSANQFKCGGPKGSKAIRQKSKKKPAHGHKRCRICQIALIKKRRPSSCPKLQEQCCNNNADFKEHDEIATINVSVIREPGDFPCQSSYADFKKPNDDIGITNTSVIRIPGNNPCQSSKADLKEHDDIGATNTSVIRIPGDCPCQSSNADLKEHGDIGTTNTSVLRIPRDCPCQSSNAVYKKVYDDIRTTYAGVVRLPGDYPYQSNRNLKDRRITKLKERYDDIGIRTTHASIRRPGDYPCKRNNVDFKERNNTIGRINASIRRPLGVERALRFLKERNCIKGCADDGISCFGNYI